MRRGERRWRERRDFRYPLAGSMARGLRMNPGPLSDPFGIPAEAHLVPLFPRARKTTGVVIGDPETVVRYLSGLDQSPVERLLVVPLSAKNEIIGVVIAAQGAVNYAEVAPREVLAPAINARAVGVILVHNHPSGSADPSTADEALTERLGMASELVGIPLIDHIVMGRGGAWRSIRERLEARGRWDFKSALRRAGIVLQ